MLQILWVRLLLPPEDHLGGLYTSAVPVLQMDHLRIREQIDLPSSIQFISN